MPSPIEIEDIEEMRRREGIDDVELRLEIRGLKPGDFVKLTFLVHSKSFQTVMVRITQVRGSAFRGKLARRVARMRAGDVVVFTASHIHSVSKKNHVEHVGARG